MEESNGLNDIEILMGYGAKIQKFYDVLLDYRAEMKEWHPEDEEEETLKKAKENLLYGLMDDYSSLFDDILARGC